MKTVTAHHPVIQKEMDEVIVKIATEPSGGAGFYSNVSVVPYYTGAL